MEGIVSAFTYIIFVLLLGFTLFILSKIGNFLKEDLDNGAGFTAFLLVFSLAFIIKACN